MVNNSIQKKWEALVARHFCMKNHQIYIVKSFCFLTCCSSSLFQFSSKYLYNTPSLLDLIMVSKALNSRLLFPECCPMSLVPTRSTWTGNEICLQGSDGNCKEHRYFSVLRSLLLFNSEWETWMLSYDAVYRIYNKYTNKLVR